VTFVSSVFVPVATMPPVLQTVVNVNPVSLLTDGGLEGLLNGGPVLEPALWSLVWAAAITVTFAPLSVWALNRRLAKS